MLQAGTYKGMQQRTEQENTKRTKELGKRYEINVARKQKKLTKKVSNDIG